MLDLRGIFPEVWPGGRSARAQPPDFPLSPVMNTTRSRQTPPTEDSLMKTKHVHVKANPPAADAKQVEAAKMARLRALRLAKEAADREAASLAAAAAPPKTRARRPSPPAPLAS